jgi:hypothetical protein
MQNQLRPELPPLPREMQHLPIDERGYPVPWFVHWPKGGKPEFRIIGPGKVEYALRGELCWVCGGRFTNRRRFFVVGPMCCVNRISGEPPCHEACAVYAARGCPFLSRPHMVRRENDLPPERVEQPAHVDHNPGLAAVWKTRSFEVLQLDDGVLFRMGEPESVGWYCEGREATRTEVYAALSKGIPKLIESCKGDAGALLECGERTAWVTQNLIPGQPLCATAPRLYESDSSPQCPFPALGHG